MDGRVEHVDWHQNYLRLREAAGIEFPGYMIHESAAWSQVSVLSVTFTFGTVTSKVLNQFSQVHQQWFFLPRRASKSKYNDVEDERHGTNMLLVADKDFGKVEVRTVGDLDKPSHGFSSFKFVPGTEDKVIVALKTEELEGNIATYIMVFKTRDGTIIYPVRPLQRYPWKLLY